jgi:hypothetical protein
MGVTLLETTLASYFLIFYIINNMTHAQSDDGGGTLKPHNAGT